MPVKKAPWAEGEFDEAKARTLVENLYAEVDGLQTKLTAANADVTTLKANISTHEANVTSANSRATAAEKALWQEKALRKHPALEEVVEFLTGDTEEAVLATADKLAKLGAKADDGKKPEPKPDDKKPEPKPDDKLDEHGKPKPDLTPGHGGDKPEPFDPVAIAKAARASQF